MRAAASHRATRAAPQAAPRLGHSASIPAAWIQAEAIALCRAIEAVCPDYGCHVALTGGLLYKDGPRKDCDLLFYRIRQVDAIDEDGLFAALASLGVERQRGFGWCHKATFNGKPIDMFFPEEQGGEYEPANPDGGEGEQENYLRAWDDDITF